MLTITFDTFINYGALATTLLGAYALYLCYTYPAREEARLRRKR
jgi:hypothetical protein